MDTIYLDLHGLRHAITITIMPHSRAREDTAQPSRLPKKRQMRWTNKGAHLLVQVRVAVLNGDLKMREMPEPLQFYAERKRDDRCQRDA
ncbi:hypothetical protein [Caballeronia sordidicola]|uniref:hypothetical protein n=1 Tax=Caballeronia sordidicola TaxID=196367 RepID=UPI000A37C209|nr:hypothetical protein [Caballeronia sordidicola]